MYSKAFMRTAFVFSFWCLSSCSTADGDLFFVDSDGVRLPVLALGNFDAQKIILYSHGGPGPDDLSDVSAGLDALGQDYLVVKWAQRSGNSVVGNSAANRMTIAQFTLDLGHIIRVVKTKYPGKQIWLYGHSWGVPLSLLAAIENEAEISGLLLSDGFDAYRPNLAFILEKIEAYSQTQIQANKDVEYWRGVKEQTASRKGRDLSLSETAETGGVCVRIEQEDGKPFQPGRSLNLASAYSPILIPGGTYLSASLQTIVMELAAFDISQKASLLKLPMLFVYGRNDCRVPAATATSMFNRFSSTRKKLTFFDGVAHVPMDEVPNEFAQAVRGFVQ
jgi:pimeloyl-ACP methyl ester carboxylesterase